MGLHGELPSLRAYLRLGGKDSNDTTTWYDVKFYPYTPPGVDPVFAVTGGCNTIICRCVLQKESCIEVLRVYKDEDTDAALNSVEWSQAENGDPLVCVSGNNPQIKILNVKTGELVTTLTGHGDAVNDLAISPVTPKILASASNDNTVKVWSLDPIHRNQPTAVNCFGEGHKETVLALGFHRTGQYLLSGGMDTKVNLWVIPKLPDQNTGTDKPTLIHYPHFSSTEIHTDFVDCVRFYGDLILSRASKENKILLWAIDNFNSENPPPPYSSVPMPPSRISKGTTPIWLPSAQTTGTRSAWGGRFQRLLQFEEPYSTYFYIRFGLFHEPGKHPILVAGNEKSRLFFWDLQRLEEAGAIEDSAFKRPERKAKKDNVASITSGISNLPLGLPSRMREGSAVSNASSAAQSSSSMPVSTTASVATGTGSNTTSAPSKSKTAKEKDDRTTGIGDSFHSIIAHKTVMVPKITFTVRQLSWSRGGEWCVAVGDHGMIAIFTRWEEGIPEPTGGVS
ncbi:WD40 repeat-like protein [Zopfia rhizophila CBS 207.26]|uniref:WD40 repeat-like protein n=1 Tax=Zopfia rhizophila CBS 207.26 TaxID=1314779 RepID=A0A6A6DM62_9PEZI|nr:WD40 repeat-like protein [Zopfia rhizophila CBS 207.26]